MDRNNHSSWFGESASRNPSSQLSDARSSFGAPVNVETGTATFESHFQNIRDNFKDRHGVDIMRDFSQMIGDTALMENYKNALLDPMFKEFREACPGDPHIESTLNTISDMWDCKLRSYSESVSVTGFLPISTLEFPVLVKQFFHSITKDIIDVENVKTPLLQKHIKTTYMVDNNTGDEYEYPKCFFDGTWTKLWGAAKGHPIKDTVVALPQRNYDIITNLTDGIVGQDKLSYDIKITAITVGGTVIPLLGNGVTVEFSTGGTLVNGNMAFTAPDGTVVDDEIAGSINFRNGTVSIASCNGQIDGVIFSGYLSNENNLRSISVRERRDLQKFTIADGARWNMPFSIEEIEDAAALLDVNYYNRMVDEVVKTQEMMEGMRVIEFLDNQYDRFDGVNTDIYKLESLVQGGEVDLVAPAGFAGDPFKYMANAVQFRIKAMIHRLTDAAKLDGLSFIIAGNPMATQLLSEWTTWKYQQGTEIGGVRVNNAYGFMTDMSAPVRVVASNIYNAYTTDPSPTTGKRELVLRIYVYPTDPEHITFKHLKYTSHLLTSQSQTAYQSINAPGGAYTVITATSRYENIAIQGLQGRLVMLNSEKVYGSI